MAYTEAWDETAPLDTSLASLLGQDIRSFKTDIRQRVASFGSGTLANRPTPEAVFAGINYLATDTHQLFQWNGSAWVDIGASLPTALSSAGILYQAGPAPSLITGTGVSQTVYTYTMPGGTLASGGGLRVYFSSANWDQVNTGPTRTLAISIIFGATDVAFYSAPYLSGLTFELEAEVYNNGSLTAQWWRNRQLGTSQNWQSGSTGGVPLNQTNENTSAPVVIKGIAQMDAGFQYAPMGFVINKLG